MRLDILSYFQTRAQPAPNTRRYLDLLKSTLLNEIYLENEARLFYISAMCATGQPLDFDLVRDIEQSQPDLMKKIRAARKEGRPWWKWNFEKDGQRETFNLRNNCEFSHTMIGRKRLDNIDECLDAIRADGIKGDLIETGVWRGGAAIFMRGYLAAHGMEGRTVWVADSFEGLPTPTFKEDAGFDYSKEQMPILAISLEEVRENFRRHGLLDDQVRFLKGWFKNTLHRAPIKTLALARLDGDLYESTRDALTALYDKLASGGFLIVDDYGDFQPCRLAVDEFRSAHGITTPLKKIDWTGVFWRKP